MPRCGAWRGGRGGAACFLSARRGAGLNRVGSDCVVRTHFAGKRRTGASRKERRYTTNNVIRRASERKKRHEHGRLSAVGSTATQGHSDRHRAFPHPTDHHRSCIQRARARLSEKLPLLGELAPLRPGASTRKHQAMAAG